MGMLGSPERVSSLGRNAGGATSGPWDGGQEREQSFLIPRPESGDLNMLMSENLGSLLKTGKNSYYFTLLQH